MKSIKAFRPFHTSQPPLLHRPLLGPVPCFTLISLTCLSFSSLSFYIMFFRPSSLLSLALALTCASSVSAHGVVTAIQGANGKTGVGFGVTDTTGKKLRLFNQASRFVTGDTSLCGSQKLNGKSQTPINEKAEVSKAIANGLPSADSTGTLSMTLFQVNAGTLCIVCYLISVDN